MTNETPAGDGAEEILAVNDITVTYRRPGRSLLTAVDGVSLSLRRSEVLGLVGESGCGKSTTARAVCGLEPLTSGSVLFNGEPVSPLSMKRRPKHLLGIQMVFQNPYASLNPRRRIGSQIEDGLGLNRQRDAWNVNELLEKVGLHPSDRDKYPHQFSGGQRQRIAIARAIGTGPDLLIGDEPIASLDASLQQRVAALMRDLAIQAGSGLLFISHDLAIVRTIADRVAVMNRGIIEEEGPVDTVWRHPTSAYARRLLAAIPVADGLGKLPGLPTRRQN
ncbi:ABC transporter ATP-binding protein [Specibacter cremeus]|uniref:ABC transporter ATP-binding protein n=1 Tax=Specibacter cremeus TaxID=1629051 RepID=UPI000F7ADDEF|nr:dipeptide/oligopeptide/nickel ABC transporter ATP-binding protein [Specibacter cremeus]